MQTSELYQWNAELAGLPLEWPAAAQLGGVIALSQRPGRRDLVIGGFAGCAQVLWLSDRFCLVSRAAASSAALCAVSASTRPLLFKDSCSLTKKPASPYSAPPRLFAMCWPTEREAGGGGCGGKVSHCLHQTFLLRNPCRSTPFCRLWSWWRQTWRRCRGRRSAACAPACYPTPGSPRHKRFVHFSAKPYRAQQGNLQLPPLCASLLPDTVPQ